MRVRRLYNDGSSYYRQWVLPYYESGLQNPTMLFISRKLHEA